MTSIDGVCLVKLIQAGREGAGRVGGRRGTAGPSAAPETRRWQRMKLCVSEEKPPSLGISTLPLKSVKSMKSMKSMGR
jgi:hypothetical protein